MVKRWMLGLAAAISVVALTGAGFSAFTASASVYGNAATGSAQLLVTQIPGTAAYCAYVTGAPYPFAVLSVTPSPPDNLSVFAGNLAPGIYCYIPIEVVNVGTLPVNLSAYLLPAAGICPIAAINGCYDAGTLAVGSGLDAIAGLLSNTALGVLPPGGVFADTVFVGVPFSFTTLPPFANFQIEYVGTI